MYLSILNEIEIFCNNIFFFVQNYLSNRVNTFALSKCIIFMYYFPILLLSTII